MLQFHFKECGIREVVQRETETIRWTKASLEQIGLGWHNSQNYPAKIATRGKTTNLAAQELLYMYLFT